MANKKTGLFFGSFNPVHNGHLMIANYICEFWDLDQVWFVISPMNPFKAEQELLADYHRRELLDRAVGDYHRFRVSAVEFSLPKPSYTIDTLTFLQVKYPEKQFLVIMGSDQLPKFHQWKNYHQILEEFSILVYPRPVSHAEATPLISDTATLYTLNTDYQFNTPHLSQNDLLNHPSITLLKAPMMEISSSFIRQSIKLGKDVRFFMPYPTWQYIDEFHFYS